MSTLGEENVKRLQRKSGTIAPQNTRKARSQRLTGL
jgi:hypothetical protein